MIKTILITGSTGLIGTALTAELVKNYKIFCLVRATPKTEAEILWDPATGIAASQLPKLENLYAVIHLAGENIASSRWSAQKKEKLISSRVTGTKNLVTALLNLQNPPKYLLSASAVGFYGDRAGDELTENSNPGQGFLSDLAKAWEGALEPAAKNINIYALRFGVVVSKNGGALKKILLPFRLGLGGKLGDGKQFGSYIALKDVVKIIKFLLEKQEKLTRVTPINVVSPQPVTNYEFTKTLGAILNRPIIFPVPAFILKLIFGEMADGLLLSSQRCIPEKLQNMGYTWQAKKIEEILKLALLKHSK